MGKITWIAGGSINETAKNDITTYTGGNYNSYGQQVTHDAEEIIWGDDPKTAPDPDPGTVSLAKFPTDANQLYTIRSYIEGNWDGSPDAYKPGNVGIEFNSNGAYALKENGDMIPKPYIDKKGKQHSGFPFGIDWDEKNNKPKFDDSGNYITAQVPIYENGNKINPKEVCYIVSTFALALGIKKGDIGYIERLDANGQPMDVTDPVDGHSCKFIFCMLADSNSSGIFNAKELDPNDNRNVFCFDTITKRKIQVPKLKTEISYLAAKVLGIKMQGVIYVDYNTFHGTTDSQGKLITNGNLQNYQNRYKGVAKVDEKGKPIMNNGKPEIDHWEETVYGDRTDFRNFSFLKDNYTLPAVLRVATTPYTNKKSKIIEYMQKGVEVFKFNSIDEYAILRIRIFTNSGDGYARTQKEINEAGSYYKKILVDDMKAPIKTEKKYFLPKKKNKK